MNDPWLHRSDNMKCKTCMWFVPKQAADPVTPGSYDLGRCRRHAPSMNGYPVVFFNDWCGDHKLDENRLPAQHNVAQQGSAGRAWAIQETTHGSAIGGLR